ncbi:MAG: hypothetical protein C0506_06175 [Anaerolinea sp.]|nr:hypothetical protein [Anaerolinea sp.]
MLPELRVLLERAEARRASLDGLLDALPADYWGRVAAGEAWSIQDQVAHLAGSEALIGAMLREVAGGAMRVWVGGIEHPQGLIEMRERALDVWKGASVDTVRKAAAGSRQALAECLAALVHRHLDATVHVAGAMDRWGGPLAWPLREYLATWTAHDPEHEASIRSAMTTPPDLSTVALTQRLRG